MRRTPASSELTAKQRYCLTTGSGSCCSGGTGPAGPAGPAGPGVACGTVYSGTTGLNAAPIIVGPSGSYALQRVGSVLFISNGLSWVSVPFSTPIYFVDTATGVMYYAETDGSGAVITIDDTGLIIGCPERSIYKNVSGSWQLCCNLLPPAGPTGPSGPAGPGVACGIVYTGTTVLTAAPTLVGPSGTYVLQINGSVLFVSMGGSWVNVGFLTPIYFFDTATGIMYYAETDNIGNAIIVEDTGLLIGCRDRNIYHNENGVWDTCCNISPLTASIAGAPVNINSTSTTALMTTSISHETPGMNAQLTASVYLTGFSGNTGQGYLYLSAAGVTGTKFPYTSGTSFPETYTIAETFTGLPTGSSTVGLYGNNTGITATGAGNLSVLYNLTPT